jgi:hypothetical protein
MQASTAATAMNPHALEMQQGAAADYLTRGARLVRVRDDDRADAVSTTSTARSSCRCFRYMKSRLGPVDKQLGALVSVVSVTVALGALPVALLRTA